MNRFGNLSVGLFNELHKKIVICMNKGGLGDVFIHRTLFEDIKKIMPESHLIFACPEKYKDAVSDHPYVDEVVNCETINQKEFIAFYDTSDVCTKYENKIAPLSDLNRSDILANYLGIKLNSHKMHIEIEKKYLNEALEKIGKRRPAFAFCPISAISSKSLTISQIKLINEKIKSLNGFLFCLHNKPTPEIESLGIETWSNLNIKQWMASIQAADYVISVDTAGFHCAGGLEKPLLGIFTFTDGKVYGKYYKSILVQKHRDNGDWPCGPCYNWKLCPKSSFAQKPCLLEINENDIIKGINTLLWQT